MATKSQPKQAPTIGNLIDGMAEILEKRRLIAEQDKVLVAIYEAQQIELIAALKNNGLDRSASSHYSASLSTVDSYRVLDMDSFMPYVAKKKAWHLLHRRVSDPALREIVALSGAVPPGLEQFVKETINLRALG